MTDPPNVPDWQAIAHAIAEEVPAPIAIVAGDGTVLMANKQIGVVFRMPAAELAGVNLLDHVPAPQRSRAARAWATAMGTTDAYVHLPGIDIAGRIADVTLRVASLGGHATAEVIMHAESGVTYRE